MVNFAGTETGGMTRTGERTGKRNLEMHEATTYGKVICKV